MAKGKHSEAEMIGALKQIEAGRRAEDVGRELGVFGLPLAPRTRSCDTQGS